jgi:hypothetical protein
MSNNGTVKYNIEGATEKVHKFINQGPFSQHSFSKRMNDSNELVLVVSSNEIVPKN